jgi:hypothetical protein
MAHFTWAIQGNEFRPSCVRLWMARASRAMTNYCATVMNSLGLSARVLNRAWAMAPWK